jgi:capsule polysaccharide modification protein KpsS
MSYSDFKTLEQINSELGIVIKDENKLYTHIEPVKLSQLFVEIMKVAFDLAIKIDTEMARQSFIVDNVLIELKRHVDISCG